MCFPASGEWRAAPCASDMAGICGTPACSHLVHVSLPEHAGDIEPPNAGSMATATTVFAPPIAFMALAPWQSATTTHSTIHFQLDFSSPVDGVAPTDLSVSAGPWMADVSVFGIGTTYNVTVNIIGGDAFSCEPAVVGCDSANDVAVRVPVGTSISPGVPHASNWASVTYVPPTPVIIPPANVQPSSTESTFNISWSAPVLGMRVDDVNITQDSEMTIATQLTMLSSTLAQFTIRSVEDVQSTWFTLAVPARVGQILPANAATRVVLSWHYEPPVAEWTGRCASNQITRTGGIVADALVFELSFSGPVRLNLSRALVFPRAPLAVVPTSPFADGRATHFVFSWHFGNSGRAFVEATRVSVELPLGAVEPVHRVPAPLVEYYSPPNATLTTSSNLTHASVVTFVATFDSHVSGVTIDFFQPRGPVVSTKLWDASLASGSASMWELTVVTVPNCTGPCSQLVSASLALNGHGVVPQPSGSNSTLEVLVFPPHPSIHCEGWVDDQWTLITNVSHVATNRFAFVATFSSRVMGVQPSDFGLKVEPAGVQFSKSSFPHPSSTSRIWTLRVDVVEAPPFPVSLAVSVEHSSGAVTPPNTASSRHSVTYRAPVPTIRVAVGLEPWDEMVVFVVEFSSCVSHVEVCQCACRGDMVTA